MAFTEDSAVVAFLIKHENIFRKEHKTTSNGYRQARINFSNSFEALRLLSRTTRLFHKDSRVVCNLLMPEDLYYEAIPSGLAHCEIRGKIKRNNILIDTHDLDLVAPGPPNWFLKGFLINIFSEDLHWKWLKRTIGEEPFLLDSKGLRGLEETLQEDIGPFHPKLIISNMISEHTAHIFPFIVLKDSHGCFADLWMEYENSDKTALHELYPNIGEEELNWEQDLLETDFIKKKVGKSHYYCPRDKVTESLVFLLEIGWKILDSQNNRILHHTEANISLTTKNNTIIVKGSVKYDNFQPSLPDVLPAIAQQKSFISLGQGFTGLLPTTWDKGNFSFLSDGEISGDTIKIPKNRITALPEKTSSALGIQIESSLRILQEKLANFSGISLSPPGKSFRGSLRPYQQEGLNWLSFLEEYGLHGILADDMGLGKTVQVLAMLSRFKNNLQHLIVVPKTLIFQWKKEIETFLPGTSIYIHSGQERLRDATSWPKNAIILCSYSILRTDIELFACIHWQCIFLDEAQAIKNPGSQISLAVSRLSAQFRLSITGTPIENNLQDLWSQFRFLMPDLLGSHQEFATNDIQHNKKKIKPFILRRLKDEVAKDLPEKLEHTVLIEMGTNQKRLYESLLSRMREGLIKEIRTDGIAHHRMKIFEILLRLRQVCCHPLLIESLLDEDDPRESGKFNALIKDLETVVEEGNKVLVYSQFTSMLNIIAKELQQKGWRYTRLDGKTKDREAVVKEFQEGDIEIFLISLKAGGVGLNLTAADYVFLYDPWWNLAVENQAISRAHRIGRKDRVIVKRYVSAGTIEEKIMDLKAYKDSMAQDILDHDDNINAISIKDLEYLLD